MTRENVNLIKASSNEELQEKFSYYTGKWYIDVLNTSLEVKTDEKGNEVYYMLVRYRQG